MFKFVAVHKDSGVEVELSVYSDKMSAAYAALGKVLEDRGLSFGEVMWEKLKYKIKRA